MAANAAPAPSPRRIHLDATGWSLLRDAAADLGLPAERLPDTPGDTTRGVATRQRLVGQDLLDQHGAPTPGVHAALVVLTTAPVAIGVERIEATRATQAVWRTGGAPTAGVLVRDRLDGDVAQRRIEVQMLAVDDLLDLVLHELATDDTGDDTTRDDAGLDPEVDDREPLEVAADDPGDLPAGLVEDDQLVARAVVTVAGPNGTTVAQLLGDGTRWWQVGSGEPGRLRLLPVRPATLRASLVSALTEQLTAAEGTDGPTPAGTGDASDG